MALKVSKLTDRSVRGFKSEGYYSDGDGLYLVVARTGGRSWIYRYRSGGARRDMGLGSMLDVSLADARLARDRAKQSIAAGRDPLAQQRRTDALSLEASPSTGMDRPAVRTGVAGRPTLLACWTDYVKAQEGGWRGRKTKAGWMRSIERHAAPIKHWPVDEIDVEAVLSVLTPLWLTKAESAGKLRERLERVLDYVRVKKLRTGPNPAVWKGNLIHLLPPRPKLQRGHMPAMPYEQIPAFMKRLSASQGMSARALEFTIFTVARETMTLEAVWGEIRADVWALDPSRMKERAFRQPLSTGALDVLKAVHPTHPRPNQLIFPGPKGGPMSNMAMDMMLRDLAPLAQGVAPPIGSLGLVADDMRQTLLDGLSGVVRLVARPIPKRRAHAVRRKARRQVLEAWSDYCLSEMTAGVCLPRRASA